MISIFIFFFFISRAASSTSIRPILVRWLSNFSGEQETIFFFTERQSPWRK